MQRDIACGSTHVIALAYLLLGAHLAWNYRASHDALVRPTVTTAKGLVRGLR